LDDGVLYLSGCRAVIQARPVMYDQDEVVWRCFARPRTVTLVWYTSVRFILNPVLAIRRPLPQTVATFVAGVLSERLHPRRDDKSNRPHQSDAGDDARQSAAANHGAMAAGVRQETGSRDQLRTDTQTDRHSDWRHNSREKHYNSLFGLLLQCFYLLLPL